MPPLPVHLGLLVLLLGLGLRAADEPPQRRQPPRQATGGVYKSRITPHWFHDNSRFWYRNDLRDGKREFIVVDAVNGKREPAFDHVRLAAALGKAAGITCKPERLPFTAIEFLDGGKALRFTVDGRSWKCDLGTYECVRAGSTTPRRDPPKPDEEVSQPADLWPDGLAPSLEPTAAVQPPRPPDRSPRSPDGKWTAFVKDSNVWLRSADGKELPLSKDGRASQEYGMLQWAPDSRTLVAFRVEPGDRHEVHLIESSPDGGGRARLRSRPYALPGDRFTAYELVLFDVANQKPIRPKTDRIDFGRPSLRWKKDGRHFTYQQVERGHQRFRLVEVDSHTGNVRNLIDERSKTFIWTAHGSGIFLRHLERTDEILYGSERDGWFHLYLLDGKDGTVKSQLTRGDWRVRSVERIDEQKRQVWFQASGKNAGQDPYLLHHYRVDFDGTNLVALTAGDGTHTVQHSPDGRFLIDTFSRVDLPPVHELRRASDGKLVCELEKADVTDLQMPEVFSAKGRDGKTDIWGIVCRPARFDPTRKYPVIEYIYAGPHDAHVPKSFSPFRRFSALTDLGFVVVQIDGMGTANRSKAFHDVCWKNLKDAGFPDRVAWHRAVAKKYPWYDTGRVGIYGTSAGGQNALGALLFHGDFYKAAVAACGCHDNRMDKASWNEQWMGYPVGPHYAASSNVDNAHRLRGNLLLIVGELDQNVPPESTLRVVDALIKAEKDFDLLVVPGMGHSDGRAYGNRRLRDFFVRHLQGVEPPDRNAAP